MNNEIRKYAYLEMSRLYNGNNNEILNSFYDNNINKNKEKMEELSSKGKEFNEELKTNGIKFLNKDNQLVKIKCARRDISTLYLKGDITLLNKREIKVMNGINYFKDIDELNHLIEEENKHFTLLFKERELKEGIIVPKGSIIFVDDDFIAKAINYQDNNLYLSGVPYKANKRGYEYTCYLTILTEWLFIKECLINDVYIKGLTDKYTTDEAFECESININYETVTNKRDRKNIYPSIRNTFLLK